MRYNKYHLSIVGNSNKTHYLYGPQLQGHCTKSIIYHFNVKVVFSGGVKPKDLEKTTIYGQATTTPSNKDTHIARSEPLNNSFPLLRWWSGAVVRASDFGQRGPLFEPRLVHILLWP